MNNVPALEATPSATPTEEAVVDAAATPEAAVGMLLDRNSFSLILTVH